VRDELTPAFHDARTTPLTQLQPAPRATRTPRTCGRVVRRSRAFSVTPCQTLIVSPHCWAMRYKPIRLMSEAVAPQVGVLNGPKVAGGVAVQPCGVVTPTPAYVRDSMQRAQVRPAALHRPHGTLPANATAAFCDTGPTSSGVQTPSQTQPHVWSVRSESAKP
jgi:hypothetical protein